MSCFFGCKVEWKKETVKVPWFDPMNLPLEGRMLKELQYGTCKKCGRIHKREVNL